MTVIEINDAINPYSIAVAPQSSAKKRLIRRGIALLLFSFEDIATRRPGLTVKPELQNVQMLGTSYEPSICNWR
jgi:hypothetical protein